MIHGGPGAAGSQAGRGSQSESRLRFDDIGDYFWFSYPPTHLTPYLERITGKRKETGISLHSRRFRLELWSDLNNSHWEIDFDNFAVINAFGTLCNPPKYF